MCEHVPGDCLQSLPLDGVQVRPADRGQPDLRQKLTIFKNGYKAVLVH